MTDLDRTDLTVVDVAELSPVDSAFVTLDRLDGQAIRWRRHSGIARNAVERAIKRPKVSRYRAAYEACRDGRSAAAIISHMPRMTAAVSDIGKLMGVRAPHLAFAFNFTELPGAAQRARMRAAFGRIDQFCVYTEFEAGLYADAFGIDPATFRPVRWTQGAPAVAAESGLEITRPYFVAVGGEGRDFATLLAAARQLPQFDFVVIARPSAALAEVPGNVTVRFNLPGPVCWAIAAGAEAVLIPLVGPETCCGHITLVSARMLGLPIVTTASLGTVEYTAGFAGTSVVSHGEADALAGAIRAIGEDRVAARARAAADEVIARSLYDRALWSDYVADFLRRTR